MYCNRWSWLAAVIVALSCGRDLHAATNLRHEGTLNMGQTSDRWRPFRSTQRVVTRRAGFDWDARITLLPGLKVHVHDAYVAGQGHLHAAVCGLIDITVAPAMVIVYPSGSACAT